MHHVDHGPNPTNPPTQVHDNQRQAMKYTSLAFRAACTVACTLNWIVANRVSPMWPARLERGVVFPFLLHAHSVASPTRHKGFFLSQHRQPRDGIVLTAPLVASHW
jgi:hypothetical protein